MENKFKSKKQLDKKNLIFNLIWLVPFLIGAVGLIISAAKYLVTVDNSNLWLFIFNIGLVLVVMDKGMDLLYFGFKELNGNNKK